MVSRSVPCRALMREGFQRAGDLGLSAALTLQRAGAHTFLPFEEGRSNGVCSRTGEEAAGPLRRDSAWVYLVTFRVYHTHPGAPPVPPSSGLASPALMVSTALLLSLHSWEQGFIEKVSCLLLLLLFQSWAFATLPPSCWCPVPQGFFINLG